MNFGSPAKEMIRQFFNALKFLSTPHRDVYLQPVGYTRSIRMIMLCVTALCLVCVGPVVAQVDVPSKLGPFQEIPRVSNPLREPFNFCSKPTPVAVDMDGDGKKDIALADYYGGEGFHYLSNTSTASKIQFVRLQYYSNPFEYRSFPLASTPTFSDMDGDGDLDMLLGAEDGTLYYYRRNVEYTNPFSPQIGAWNGTTKAGNPMTGIDLGSFASPVFNDFDNDGDEDLIIGSSYLPANKSVHYFVNDGQGNFTPGTLTGINPNLAEVTPSLLDVDGDGDTDIVIGAADGNLYYFKRVGQTSFEEQTGANNPFTGINHGNASSPTTADFDNDGDTDLIFGAQNINFDIFYLENKGAGVFEEKVSFDNPFGGVTVTLDSSPLLTDLDNDGDLDMIIGNSWNYIKYLRNDNGTFVELPTHPFSGLAIADLFTPSFVDIDADGDKDLVGSVYNGATSIVYFRNDDGVFVEQPAGTLYAGAISSEEGHADFTDIDNDGDYDFFVSEQFFSWELGDRTYIRFFKNVGTPQIPSFIEMTGAQNPLDQVEEEFALLPRFVDIDHDGDLDALIGEGGDVIEISDGNEFSFYENIGTPYEPNFYYRGDLMQQGNNPFELAPTFGDFDNDGDLDLFTGNSGGEVSYYQNTNYPATTQVTAEPLIISVGAPATTIDALLTISDPDNDSIVYAEVVVQAYTNGQDELTFTTIPSIAGQFNTTTGVLTFKGKASTAEYQEVLRTVKFQMIEPSSGRVKSGPLATINRVITFRAVDADGTNTVSVSRTINFISGQPPVFSDQAVSLAATQTINIDLTTLIADPDGNADLSTLTIVQQPLSGATASINNAGSLTVNYNGLAFTGTETLVIRVCDTDGSCDENTITVTVTNTPPVFADQGVTLPYAGQTTIDVSTLVSDTENNVSEGTLQVLTAPSSGAVTSVSGFVVSVNYSAVNFSGTETITLQICDLSGACDQSTFSITINNTPPVIQPEAVNTPQGSTKVLNLLNITSDPDQNLDPSTIEIVESPSSGAVAAIEMISETEVNLILDYSGITFSGVDYITIRACDEAGACAESVLAVQVDVEAKVEVYNAVAPNSSEGDNKFLRILNLPAIHKVSIFNRWGDEVFETSHYDNESIRFEGKNKHGNALATGTYFYQIEYVDPSDIRQTISGYLSLKQ
jgi:hypothetical protein